MSLVSESLPLASQASKPQCICKSECISQSVQDQDRVHMDRTARLCKTMAPDHGYQQRARQKGRGVRTIPVSRTISIRSLLLYRYYRTKEACGQRRQLTLRSDLKGRQAVNTVYAAYQGGRLRKSYDIAILTADYFTIHIFTANGLRK